MKSVTLAVNDINELLLDDEVLLYYYPDGDVDICPWPMTSEEHYNMLFSTLYDAVNTGDLDDDTEVILPDGTAFGKSNVCEFIKY